jgi:hypothetical protein
MRASQDRGGVYFFSSLWHVLQRLRNPISTPHLGQRAAFRCFTSFVRGR